MVEGDAGIPHAGVVGINGGYASTYILFVLAVHQNFLFSS